MGETNDRKAAKLYDAIDGSELFSNPVEKPFRSLMNIPFILEKGGVDAEGIKAMEMDFKQQAAERGLVTLGGHRSVGGMRASIYNAMPEAGVDALVELMQDFEEQHA